MIIDEFTSSRRQILKEKFNDDLQFISSRLKIQKGFSKKNKIEFYLELASLLDSGIQLSKSIDLMYESWPQKHQHLFLTLKSDLVNGFPISVSLKNQNLISDYEFEILQIGEMSSNLIIVLKDLADHFQTVLEIEKQLHKTLIYPVIVILTAIFAMWFMLVFIVPLFQDLFNRIDQDLPYITSLVIKVSNHVGMIIQVLLIALAAILLCFIKLRRNKPFMSSIRSFIGQIPFLSQIYLLNQKSRFCTSLLILLKAGISIDSSIIKAGKTFTYPKYNIEISSIHQDLIHGKSLNYSLKNSNLFSIKEKMQLSVAEESHSIISCLDKICQNLKSDLKLRSEIISSLIEPIILLFLGFVIGIILIALYLPIFQMTQAF